MSDQNKTEENQNQDQEQAKTKSTKPDYFAVQYRVIRTNDGWKELSERIGAAWAGDKGGFTFRPSGRQIIENDIHFVINKDD